MDYGKAFADRLAQLRLQKGVSARDMSLSLGQSESYINKIENRRTLPSMTGFFYICEYFGISPRDFFDEESSAPTLINQLQTEARRLSPSQIELLLALAKNLQ